MNLMYVFYSANNSLLYLPIILYIVNSCISITLEAWTYWIGAFECNLTRSMKTNAAIFPRKICSQHFFGYQIKTILPEKQINLLVQPIHLQLNEFNTYYQLFTFIKWLVNFKGTDRDIVHRILTRSYPCVMLSICLKWG